MAFVREMIRCISELKLQLLSQNAQVEHKEGNNWAALLTKLSKILSLDFITADEVLLRT